MTQHLYFWAFILENENLCLYKTLYMNIHNSFICNSPKLEMTQMSFSVNC